jgi:hypothetical protein
VARVVVISTAEVDRSLLEEHVAPDDEVVVVVPAVEQSRLDWLTNDEGDARQRAAEVGETISDDAPTVRAEVEVTPAAPSQAVLDAVAEHAPDRIVVALRAGEDATWLEEGELGEVPGRIAGLPVTRVLI